MRMKKCCICKEKKAYRHFDIIEFPSKKGKEPLSRVKKEIACKKCKAINQELVTVRKFARTLHKFNGLANKKDIAFLDKERENYFMVFAEGNYIEINKKNLFTLLKKDVIDIYNKYIVVLKCEYKAIKQIIS